MEILLEINQGHRIEEDYKIMLSLGMSSALLAVPLILVAILKHSELAVYSFCNLGCVFQKGVTCQLKVLNTMREYHVQFQCLTLTYFKLVVKFQEIFTHFGNHRF